MDDTTSRPANATRPQVCPGCGMPSRSRAAFCQRCGATLPDAPTLTVTIGDRFAPPPAPAEGEAAPGASPAADKGARSAGTDGQRPDSPIPAAAVQRAAVSTPTPATETPPLGIEDAWAAPTAVVHMDADGRITSVNPAATRLLSIGAEAVGRPYTAVFGKSTADRMLRLFLRAVQGAHHDQLQTITIQRPDGQALALQATISTQHAGDGSLRGFVFTVEEPGATSFE